MQTRMNMQGKEMDGMLASRLASKGRNGDTMIGHLTPGEIVVPISAQTPALKKTVFGTMESMGIPPERFVVGSEKNSINPDTGLQEHGLGSFLKKAAKIAIPAAIGYATGGWAGAAKGAMSGLGGGLGGEEAVASGGDGGGGSGGGGNNLPPTTNAAISSLDATSPSISRTNVAQLSSEMPAPSGSTAPSVSFGGSGGTDGMSQEEILKIISAIKAGNALDGNQPVFGNSVNPSTGMPEFADPYSTPKTNNEKALRDLGYTGDFGAGGGDAWLKANPDKNTAYTQKFNQTGADNWAKPVAASTPAPNETITGIYSKNTGSNLFPQNKTAVTTNTGSIYNANFDANTGKTSYEKATGIEGFAPVTGSEYRFNGSKGGPVVTNIGGQIPGQQPAANTNQAAATAATSNTANTGTTAQTQQQTPKETYSTPKYANEKLLRDLGYTGAFGAGGANEWLAQNPNINAEYKYRYSQMGGNRELSPAELQQYAPQQQQQMPSWVNDMQRRIDDLTRRLETPEQTPQPVTSTTTAPETVSTPEPAMVRTSSLTPTRSRRFNSRRWKGSLARNF